VKAERDLGWKATVRFEDGLARTVAWTRDNLAMIRATIARHDAPMRALAAQAGA